MISDEELGKRLDEQGVKLNAIFASVEKTRRYFLILIISSIVIFILPLFGLLFAIPAFLNNYTSVLGI
ncbi:MAG TPA: hypothetical protein VJH21_00735 [Candidatus Paceibacterota bacterium]